MRERPSPPATMRLQKYLSDCGITSRRAAEKEILNGTVTVNGVIAELGQKIDPQKDEVRYQGQVVAGPLQHRYLMLYKPRGYVTTLSDDRGRKCILDLLTDVSTRVYPCGRLDMDSEGLLLLTNDGAVAQALMHPRVHVEKVYQVRIMGEISPEDLAALNETMVLDGYPIQPVKVTILSRKEGQTLLQFVLTEGRNRQIRKMCEQRSLSVVRLKRVAVGRLRLGPLKPGKWRALSESEIRYLKSLAEQK